MKVRMAMRSLSIAIILVLVAVSGAAAANGAKKVKVGKTGLITLKAPTNIGAFTLAPGRYLVQHRVVGSDHRIHFTLLKENLSPWARSRSGTMEVPDEVSCRLEAMNNKRARHTIVFTEQEGDSRRINRIEIKGEDVAHVF